MLRNSRFYLSRTLATKKTGRVKRIFRFRRVQGRSTRVCIFDVLRAFYTNLLSRGGCVGTGAESRGGSGGSTQTLLRDRGRIIGDAMKSISIIKQPEGSLTVNYYVLN